MSKSTGIGWEDVRPYAAEMFNIWVSESALEFAREAWGHFNSAGLVKDKTLIEITSTKLRLVTLARIYEEFCSAAWEENSDGSISRLAEEFGIDSTALGILVPPGNIGQFDHAADADELRETALWIVTEGQRDEIFECLKAAYGGELGLYLRLRRTNSSREYANEEEELDDWDETTDDFQFVFNGFRKD